MVELLSGKVSLFGEKIDMTKKEEIEAAYRELEEIWDQEFDSKNRELEKQMEELEKEREFQEYLKEEECI